MDSLGQKTCKELREIAKGFEIKGRWDMTKQELIDAIEKVSNSPTNNNIKDNGSINPEGSQKVTKTTFDYLKAAEPGTLVAFKKDLNKDLAMSGKVVRFEPGGKVVVETKRGTEFTLDVFNIIWVKRGERWPRWVYNLFNSTKGGGC